MSSPVPPDPYEALGIPKDADTSAIRTSHRKLVLKHHPDRIQDPALKEKGKDAFQKIQQAYEILSDPVRRARYDDKIKLAELRKEAMMRDLPRTHTYPMRPPQHSASSSREWNSDDHAFYETRRPRESDFDSKDRFEPPNRTASRKHAEYERGPPTKKPEKAERATRAAWGRATEAVKNGIRVAKESDSKAKTSKAHQFNKESRDREKRQARSEKDRRAFVVDHDDSDSDTATRVTSSTARPSKSVPRPDPSRTHSSGYQRRAYTDDDSDTATYVSSKWERSHFDAKEYMQKAAAATGHRPSLSRGDSLFWGLKNVGSEGEKRPPSSGGRRTASSNETPTRPPMPSQTSAPSNLKHHVDERGPKDRRSATAAYPEMRKEMPSFQRSNTMPASRPSSRRDAAPPKPSHLKHAETHDSGYGSSPSPHTPELREESPPRRPKPTSTKSSTKYKIVDPAESDDDQRTQIRVVDSDSDRKRHPRTSEHSSRDYDRRKDKVRGPEHARGETRSRSSRDAPVDPSKPRRTDSAKYGDEPRSPHETPRGTPVLSRHGSGKPRERERVSAQISDDEEMPYRSKYPSGEKINLRSPYCDSQAGRNRDGPDRRDYLPQGFSTSRRTSIPTH